MEKLYDTMGEALIKQSEECAYLVGVTFEASDWEWQLGDMTVRPAKDARVPNRLQRLLLRVFLDIRWRRVT